MIIVGLNAYHGDSSACVVIDGKMVAAAEEERFRRVKHWAGFPAEAIRYCLREAGVGLGDIARVAINQDSKANLWRKAGYLLSRRPDLSLVMERIRNKRERARVDKELERCFPGERFVGEIHEVEHHLAHLGSAFLVSPFEHAVAVSVDGFGDFASAAWGVGEARSVEVDERVYFPHSLGIFYQAMTQYLGFPHYGDEYKVMGLAPYGEPRYVGEMRQIVSLRGDGKFELNLDYFRHHREKVEYEWDNGEPVVGTLFSPKLEELLGPAIRNGGELTQRYRDVARSVQAMYEEAFFNLLNRLYDRYKLERLVLAGGCAMNSVANGKIYRNTSFRGLYIQSAPGDAGGAIGAAFVTWHKSQKDSGSQHERQTKVENQTENGRFVMDHAFWGPKFGSEYIAGILRNSRGEMQGKGCAVQEMRDEMVLCGMTAEAIAEGKVVGWFQGRMEWGPRALGNRSILCDPRRPDMKNILNLKIKRRESFRPFAPSILREAVPEWFETDDDVPFMTQVYQVREDKRSAVPAVTHVDGSGRLQTVYRASNPRYYRLIEAFNSLTGVPMILNTSFNENEPVVCSPEEALDCFMRTKMDVLVLGDFVVRRAVGLS
jgi:carbamoyltransferase